MRALALAIALLPLAASAQQSMRILCASPGDTTCPPQCRKDLSHHYDLVRWASLGPSTAGAYLVGKLVINKDMPERYHAAAKHHEACHREMELLTGKPNFHP